MDRTVVNLRWHLVAAACLAFLWGGGSPALGVEAGPVSIVQVPLELDLAPLFKAAESALPTQIGSWPGWRDWHGIDTRYRAWRGPLQLSMQGETLQAQAHVRYQLQARKSLIGRLGLSVGCGVDEPPRQAMIGLLARLDWGPDWSLQPRFQVLPTRFLDRCEVTLADIDVSPLVGRVFEERIESSLREAMATLGPRLQGLRGEAARLWQALQTPRELAPGLWLRIEPLGFALAPPQGAGSRVQTAAWLAFRAAIASQGGPVGYPRPLPPLVPYRPAKPGLELALGLELDYGRLSAVLGERLAGETFVLEGREARLEGLELGAKGEDLRLVARVSGDIAGRLTLLARPGFDPAAGTLRLEDLGFIFDAADPDQGLIAGLFHERIRERIESEANRLLAQRSRGLMDALQARLAADLPPALAPDLSGLQVKTLRLGVRETGLDLNGSVAGPLRLGATARP
ncbi:MAG: DUF4403 family protein [Bdellovibrio bacteriovorus]